MTTKIASADGSLNGNVASPHETKAGSGLNFYDYFVWRFIW
jgi:hypothetical protein